MISYVAIDESGKKVKGELNALNEDKARAQLIEKGMFPVEVKEHNMTGKFMLRKRISKKDLAILMRQMATMFKAQVPIQLVFSTLIDGEKKAYTKEVLSSIYMDVMNGSRLSNAFKKFPNVFDNYIISMLEVGETKGSFDTAFGKIADVLEKDTKLTNKVKGAMVYPIILVTLSVGIIILLSTVVMPTFSAMFSDMGAELPWLTQVLIAVSNFIIYKWWVVVILAVLAVTGFRYFWKSSIKFRKYLEYISMRLPVIKGLKEARLMNTYCMTIASLLDAGVNILPALTVTKNTLTSKLVQEYFQVAIDSVRMGDNIATALQKAGGFTSLVIKMTEIGEKGGNLIEIMESTAGMYEEEAERKVTKMIAMLEPAMTIVLAVVVGGIVLAIVLPMFDMYSLIS